MSEEVTVRNQRDEIYEALVTLMVTRKAGTPIEEIARGFENAVRVVDKYRGLMDGDTWSKPREDMTVRNLVSAMQHFEANDIVVKGHDEKKELEWIVVGAIGKTATRLSHWSEIDQSRMTSTILAQIAYQSYGDAVDNKNYLGNPMPKWKDLPGKIREAWTAVAVELVAICGQSVTSDNKEVTSEA